MRSAKHSEIRASKLGFPVSRKSLKVRKKGADVVVALTAESLQASLLRAPMSSPAILLKSKIHTRFCESLIKSVVPLPE